MRGVVFHRPFEVAYESVPDPSLEAAGDVLVRVEAAAICGSDLHPYRGAEAGLDAGTVLGHEFAGEVMAVGAEVRGLAPGDRVVSPFSTNCGECFYCSIGLTSRCARGELFGWVEEGRGLQGAQAELVRVPLAEATLVRLPEGVDAEAALFVGDILATAHFCADMAEVGPGSVAVVLGCGPVGLLTIVAAHGRGAERVIAVDSVPERLSRARDLGAQPLRLGEEDVAGGVRAATEGRGADAVLEVVGSAAATRLAVDLVRPGGVIAAAGFHTEKQFAFGPGEAYDKNLTYRAGRCPARRYMDELLSLVAEGRFPLADLVSHRLPLAEAPRAYELFDRKLDGCTKVVLRPS
jgi:threonine dehydrogenase-like Zn-dependent dehydrogenase